MTATIDQLQSRERVEPGSHDIALGEFPSTCSTIPENPDSIASEAVEQLNRSLSAKDNAGVASLFIENSYWRDHLCHSWDFHTIKGNQAISVFTTGPTVPSKIEIDRSSALKAPHVGPIDAFGEVNGIEFFIKITTQNGHGNGVVRLAEDSGKWKFFTVFATLVGATGIDEATGPNRPAGAQHGEQQGRNNWKDRRIDEANFEKKDPAVLIVGMWA